MACITEIQLYLHSFAYLTVCFWIVGLWIAAYIRYRQVPWRKKPLSVLEGIFTSCLFLKAFVGTFSNFYFISKFDPSNCAINLGRTASRILTSGIWADFFFASFCVTLYSWSTIYLGLSRRPHLQKFVGMTLCTICVLLLSIDTFQTVACFIYDWTTDEYFAASDSVNIAFSICEFLTSISFAVFFGLVYGSYRKTLLTAAALATPRTLRTKLARFFWATIVLASCFTARGVTLLFRGHDGWSSENLYVAYPVFSEIIPAYTMLIVLSAKAYSSFQQAAVQESRGRLMALNQYDKLKKQLFLSRGVPAQTYQQIAADSMQAAEVDEEQRLLGIATPNV